MGSQAEPEPETENYLVAGHLLAPKRSGSPYDWERRGLRHLLPPLSRRLPPLAAVALAAGAGRAGTWLRAGGAR